MRTLLFALYSTLAIAGCSKNSAEPPAVTEAVPEVSVDELDQLLASNAARAVDANGEGTRKKLGVIPNAVLLSDSDVIDVKLLPADKSKALVFYCANTHCGASHEAAGQARVAGYTNVKVLPAGIAGWVEAGKHVQKI